MNLLLDNFDAMQGVFSIADGMKVYADAKTTASLHYELNTNPELARMGIMA